MNASTAQAFRSKAWLAVRCLCLLGVCGAAGCQRQVPVGAAEAAQQDVLVVAEAATTPGHRRMLALLETVAARAEEENLWLGEGTARALQQELAELPRGAPERKRRALTVAAAEAQLGRGRVHEAIDLLSQAYRRLPDSGSSARPEGADEVVFRLGLAYLRLGEIENCCARFTPESCLLPIRGEGIHTRREGSQRAVEYFTEVLGSAADGTMLHMKARWLLNIAYMTLGEYPDGVPSRWLIPPQSFESKEPFPRFANVAPGMGLDTDSVAGGAIVEDFDSDGYLDLMVSLWDPSGQLRLFHNAQDGSFRERAHEAGLRGILGGNNLIQADYNNDGWVDVLMLRGGWLEEGGRYPNSLLRNNGDGTFTDVTFEAGLADVHYPTQTAAWADYDHDGNLDLYIGNEWHGGIEAPGQLFHNQGDGTFVDVAREAGVRNERMAKAVVWGDHDGDRWPDLYVSNLRGQNRLYRNLGDGTFRDVAPELGVTGPVKSFTSWFWDFDNDGALDLFVAAYDACIGDLAAAYLGHPPQAETARLYRGDGRGGFEEVARSHNLIRPTAPMGANFGDLNNDGYLDFYLGTGYPDFAELMPNVMYVNRSGQRFVDVTTAGGFGHLQKGHAVVFADLDHDGDQDVFQQMGGAYQGDTFRNSLYENPGFGNHWISVDLVGVNSNRSAIGARIRIDVVDDGVRRSIYRHVNSGGSFGANPLRQTIGLGRAAQIERLEIFWPATGETQAFHEVRVDRLIRIVEDDDEFESVPARRLKLGERP